MFWSYMFPILLAYLFYFAFGNLWNNETFETIDIGYVGVDNEVDQLLETMEEAKISEETLLFNVAAVSKDTAAKRLENGDFAAEKTRIMVINEDGETPLIEGLLSYLDQYVEYVDIKHDENSKKDALFF